MNQIMPISTIRSQLPNLVNQVNSLGNTITINVSGRPQAVLLSYEQYESLVETLEIVSDKKLMQSIAKSEQEIKLGKLYTLEDVLHPGKQKTVSISSKSRIQKSPKKLEQLNKNPYLGKMLLRIHQGKFSLRAWPYRIVYITYQSSILIFSIQYRKDVYRDLN